MIGTPVIIGHQDVTDKNVDKIRKGTISNAYFNEPDGWYYCEGIITDKEAEKLIESGWSVSCSYDFLSYDDEGGVENNIKYDKEFTNLNFTHLAIVDNPRYERANIVFNSKDGEGKWVTIKGNHIFIPDGKTLDEVIKEKGWGEKENKQSESKKETKISKGDNVYLKSQDGPNRRIGKIVKQISEEVVEVEFPEKGNMPARTDRYYIDELNKEEEPEWLKHEREKLDHQTTQMYEDRYSLENPEKYKENLEKAKSKQNPDDELVTVQKADTHKLEVRLNDLKSRYNEVMKYYWEADEDDRDIHQYKADAIKDEILSIQDMLDKLKNNKANNSKEQDMVILNELKKLISKVENEKGEQDMDEKEKVDNKKVDKRKLIDEVGGILKGKVDDEIIRTVMKKMEEASYNGSEDDKADNEKEEDKKDKKDDVKNKCKNETEEDKKEVKEIKEDVKEDIDNKCKNSKPDTSCFDKINEIYNSVKQVTKENNYVSRQEKLDNAVEYFK